LILQDFFLSLCFFSYNPIKLLGIVLSLVFASFIIRTWSRRCWKFLYPDLFEIIVLQNPEKSFGQNKLAGDRKTS